MGTLKELKKTMRQDEELSKLLVRSGRHEILIDLDGDSIPDICLEDFNRDGDIDTMAVDATGNGEFNLYVSDQDANGIIDTVEFYEDGENMPVAAYYGKNVEERFERIGDTVYNIVNAREYIKEEIIDPMREFVASAIDEYKQVVEETEETEKD